MTLRLLICLVLMASIKTTTAQTVSIPDTNFEQALIDLNLDSDNTINGEISQADVESVITLNVNNKNINSLDGIEGFTSLKNLLCGNNNLTTIDLSANVALETLDISNNDLVNLDLSQNIALTSLIAIANNLSNLDIQNNQLLTYVNVPFNQISSIDVSNNLVLETLFLLNNNLSSLDVSGLNSLVRLYCYNNSLTSLNVNNASSLTTLRCYNNSIQDLNLETNSNLLELHCFNNNISSLNLDNNLLLEDLRCHRNNIVELDLTNNSLLTSIVCFDNNLTSLNLKNGSNTNISSIVTTNNSELTCIDVDDAAYSAANWINIDPQTSFSEDCNPPETILIPGINFELALIALNIDTNGLNGNILKSEAEAVTYLGVSNRNIYNLEGIEGFTNLLELYCNDNNLSILDVSQNSLLRELSFDDNQLTNLDISNNTALEYLYGSRNNLMALDINNNTLLKELICSQNSIASLDVTNNTLLKDLVCNSNQLTTIDVSNNPGLLNLNVHYNELISLNIKNGFNINIGNFEATNNPNLSCIEVDDETYSTTNWTFIDPQTSFSENCGTLGIGDEFWSNAINIYPNPASDVFYIKGLQETSQLKIVDINGRFILNSAIDTNTSLNVSTLPSGIYFIQIINSKGSIVKKLIKS